MVTITKSEIDIAGIIQKVTSPGSGGIDVFIGTTRNASDGREVVSLTYEAYEPMAIKIIERIEEEARRRWPLDLVAVVHRLGDVPIGEASVAVAVSAAHRKEAFEACRFLIDELKREAPIWKKELFRDGSSEWPGIVVKKGEGVTE